MSNVILKGKSNTAEGRVAGSIKHILEKNPQKFWQPGDFIRHDKLTGKDYMDPRYVELYGNPYNEEDPKSIWITLDLNKVEDEMRRRRKVQEAEKVHLHEIEVNLKYQTQFSESPDHILCVRCEARNYPYTHHCFYCGGSLYLSRLITLRRI